MHPADIKTGLTATQLRALLDYSSDTGAFTWRDRVGVPGWNTRYAGTVAGTPNPQGYLRIRINNHAYLAHRLAWLYVHGVWPKADIDHISGLKADNRIANLRQATRRQNNLNASKRVDNTSGVKGVCWDTECQKWAAYIRVHNRQIKLGRFTVFAAAVRARRAAEEKHFGTFRRAS